jgi:hypothetical protein
MFESLRERDLRLEQRRGADVVLGRKYAYEMARLEVPRVVALEKLFNRVIVE